ncbi:unnamed protein product [Caenorhabditis angaria]|uniref:DUF281 domain-containing protein n=1 Tax=Caenorhabditis angaria TaxID=860376 RepID=A0A9P1IL06_9PELO|nr:unnamed protein product [Caenorhabditis angaria]
MTFVQFLSVSFLSFITLYEACIPTQQVETTTSTTTTTTTVGPTCPVCGTIYQRNCVNSFGSVCQTAAAISAIPTLSGTTCTLSATCPDDLAFYYLTDGSEEYNHVEVGTTTLDPPTTTASS